MSVEGTGETLLKEGLSLLQHTASPAPSSCSKCGSPIAGLLQWTVGSSFSQNPLTEAVLHIVPQARQPSVNNVPQPLEGEFPASSEGTFQQVPLVRHHSKFCTIQPATAEHSTRLDLSPCFEGRISLGCSISAQEVLADAFICFSSTELSLSLIH